MKLLYDNKVTISIAKNPVQHDKTKHVKIDQHFIKERLDNGSICIPYIPSSQQVANVLTKGLLIPNFNFCVSKLELIDIYVPTWGGVLELVILVLIVFMERLGEDFPYFLNLFLSYSIVYSTYSSSLYLLFVRK